MKMNSKSKQLTPKVISLYNTTDLTSVEIGKIVGLETSTVKKIAVINDISEERYNKKPKSVWFDEARNNEIVSLLKKGLSYVEIGRKMGVTKQRIYQFAKINGISKWEESREAKLTLKQNIDSDIKNGSQYSELKSKYGRRWLTGVSAKLRNNRNLNIITEYKQKTANEVLECIDYVFINPNKLTNRNSIYNITSKHGFKKYPMIGNRRKGGTFENIKVIEFIKNNRDNNKLSFREITNLLNTKGLKTITGKEFTEPNVAAKYHNN